MIKKYVVFKKNMKGWNMNPEIFHEDKTDESEKTSQNDFFIFQPFIVKT